MANFYLFRPVAGNVHRLIAWDRDTTFQEIDASIFARVQENALFRRALMFPDLRALYLDVLEQCARAAAEDRWLEAELLQVHRLIRDAVRKRRTARPIPDSDSASSSSAPAAPR